MEALVKMLKNTKENTYHPIMYSENPFFASGCDSEMNQKVIRYKSKGHRTIGFPNRQDAINSIDAEITDKLIELGYNINKELDDDIEWDGLDIPADVQIRNRKPAENFVFNLHSENLTHLGGSMGTEYTFDNYVKPFATVEDAKIFAEKEYSLAVQQSLANNRKVTDLKWIEEGNEIRTPDLSFVMYRIIKTKVG